MQVVVHRINTIEHLKQVPSNLGVEIDLRSQGSRIILNHDPFCEGEDFEQWLEYYQHQLLILNVKEEGLEKNIINLLSKRSINNYFFLDISFPFLVWLSDEGFSKMAVRFSEYECLHTVLNMSGRVEWVWIDCFTELPINHDSFIQLKKAGFKLCLVSPELQKKNISTIKNYIDHLTTEAITIDAVCTKKPDHWNKLRAINYKL